MKIKLVAAAVMGLMMSSAMAATDVTGVKTDAEKLSYSIGNDLGKNFKRQGIEINSAAMAQGITDGMSANSKPLMSDEQMKDVLTKFQKDIMSKRAVDFSKKAEENKANGAKFLSENKGKPGVVTLPSGLQYKIIKNGSGEKPAKDDMVTVEYTGKLINGEVFDSTSKTGQPATFKLSQVIPGWVEALQLMPAGSTWEIYVPASLAYGERSVGGPIGPNETLVFNIHLISAKKGDAAS
jgi:FKBP-type peptidyl-prolyl cis-trans isomerase FklB